MKNQNKTFMVKTMGPFRDSRAPSWLPGPEPMFPLSPPLIGPASINKTDRHDITEILLKVTLNTIKSTNLSLTVVGLRHTIFFFLSRALDSVSFLWNIYIEYLK